MPQLWRPPSLHVSLAMAGLVSSCLLLSAQAAAADRVTPGSFVVDHPTLINLGFEWLIDGDANRNATVEVSYRKQGETRWKRGMPLLRLQGERIYQENSWNLVVAEHVRRQHPRSRARHGLRSAVRHDRSRRRVRARPPTRRRPSPCARARSRCRPRAAVSITSTRRPTRARKQQPAFEGIMCAYYYTCGGGDTTTTGAAAREAGRHDPRARGASTPIIRSSTARTVPQRHEPVSKAPTTWRPAARRTSRSPSRRPATAT